MDLLRARDEQARLQDEQTAASRTLELKNAEKHDLTKRLEQENARNRVLTSTLYDLEGKSRATEDALNVARREQNDLRFSNQAI